jgi:hypothetical protein
MNLKLKEILLNSIQEYNKYLENKIENPSQFGYRLRVIQMNTLVECLSQHFDFDEINLIETGVSGSLDYGLFGLFFAHTVDQYGGEMHSVDLNPESCLNSETIFKSELPNLKYKTYCQDSVEFLKTPPIIPNLIHLDSYDFQLFNPFPSALHAWKEFKAIEHLMPKGSIIIIDDNWKQGGVLQWIQNGEETLNEIVYPMIGKGSHLYQEALAENIGWELIGNHYDSHHNIKIVLKKK